MWLGKCHLIFIGGTGSNILDAYNLMYTNLFLHFKPLAKEPTAQSDFFTLSSRSATPLFPHKNEKQKDCIVRWYTNVLSHTTT